MAVSKPSQIKLPQATRLAAAVPMLVGVVSFGVGLWITCEILRTLDEQFARSSGDMMPAPVAARLGLSSALVGLGLWGIWRGRFSTRRMPRDFD